MHRRIESDLEDLVRKLAISLVANVERHDAALSAPEAHAMAAIYLRWRRARDNLLNQDGLFHDPSWDMLIDLFVSEAACRRVSVSSVCIASAAPATTALRHLGVMHQRGLIERVASPDDGRKIFVELTDYSRLHISRLFGDLASQLTLAASQNRPLELARGQHHAHT